MRLAKAKISMTRQFKGKRELKIFVLEYHFRIFEQYFYKGSLNPYGRALY